MAHRPARSVPDSTLLPLGALMLAASVSSWAQTSPESAETRSLRPVVVKDKTELEGKEALRATRTAWPRLTASASAPPMSSWPASTT